MAPPPSPSKQGTAGPTIKRPATSGSGYIILYSILIAGLLTTVVLALATHLSLKAAKPGSSSTGLTVVPTDPASETVQSAGGEQAASADTQDHVRISTDMPGLQQQLRVVVVGGGLAGCTAALSVQAALQSQWATSNVIPATNTSPSRPLVEVVLVEKTPKLGGNSAKASSGINALNPPAGDSQQLFEQDTLKSGGDLSKPELVATLVAQSQDAIQFLESHGIDLSTVTQLGGHSVPRSHANPVGGNVGWTIMSKMMQAVKAAGVTVMEGHKLEELVLSPTGALQNVVLTTNSAEPGAKDSPNTLKTLTAQAVILAAGGFAANRTLLQQHCPAAAELATTNGPWAQGDVLAVAQRVGARLRDLDQVQVHPTGFVDPKDPAAGTKFLAPEKLRGVGGILLNKEGMRFVDELTTRDKASDAVTSQPGREAWLLLSEAAAADYGLSAVQFYAAKGLMTKVEGVSGLAAHTGVEASVLSQQLQRYNRAKEGQEADVFGKKFFPTGFDEAGVMYVGRITPVVHYTMGGVEIDSYARVLGSNGQPIPGLYAAGEVSGGVHGRNRLGGNSLLECTVYGRIAGWQAAQHVMGLRRAESAAATA